MNVEHLQINLMLFYVMNIIMNEFQAHGSLFDFSHMVIFFKQGERCSGGQRQQWRQPI